MDIKTRSLAQTLNHMNNIYPLSNLSLKKKFNNAYNERSENNSTKILTLMNGGQEKLREDTEKMLRQANSNPSYKSKIYNT